MRRDSQANAYTLHLSFTTPSVLNRQRLQKEEEEE